VSSRFPDRGASGGDGDQTANRRVWQLRAGGRMNRANSWSSTVPNLTTIEAKAFVPARDFALSKRFYQDLGFDLAWSDDHLAYLRHGNSSFLLQNFYNAEHAGNS
jgi:hypothetical protein